ncbi:MAG TPA: hypothetical protein DIW23_07185 [Anaerolineae bacterium]|nr:hypothetical protein [Anaerolineae bacterium]HRJ76094.1 hypothetical protein [Anaerolineales bacterium]
MTDQIYQENFDEIETHLAGTLKPVTAPSGLFQRLYERIQFPTPSEITLRLSDWRKLIFVFGGVLSGMLLLVTLARALYHIVGRKGVM